MGVAQLVERQTVDLEVAGSNPVTHPIIPKDLTKIAAKVRRPTEVQPLLKRKD